MIQISYMHTVAPETKGNQVFPTGYLRQHYMLIKRNWKNLEKILRESTVDDTATMAGTGVRRI